MIRACILFSKEDDNLVPSSVENPPAPSFSTGERITGRILISNNVTREPLFDAVQLLLRGRPARFTESYP
jgi:hypothetical protein